MSAPFFKFGLFGDEASFIIAFVIGIGFGFFLERAGFGSARKLAAQFYFRDLSVLKVMFTAIITAMSGLYLLSRIGFVDLSLVYLVPTFILPQIVGGVLLGVGFVVGGYCPGTSCVSAATGRIDGMVYVLGMVAGLLGFAEVYPFIANFAHSTPMGQITLAKLFNLPYGLLVFAVVLMALGMFAAGEWVEKKIGGKQLDENGSLIAQVRRLTPVRSLALGLSAVGLFAAFAGNPYRGSRATIDTRDLAAQVGKGADLIKPTELANLILQDRNDFRLIDLRGEKEFAAYHIPTAQNHPLAALTPDFAAHNEKLLLYAGDGAESSKAWFLLKAQGFKNVYTLDGGMHSWQDAVLFPRKQPGMDSALLERESMIAKYFGGALREQDSSATNVPVVAGPIAAPAAQPVAPPAGGTGPHPRKKKEGC